MRIPEIMTPIPNFPQVNVPIDYSGPMSTMANSLMGLADDLAKIEKKHKDIKDTQEALDKWSQATTQIGALEVSLDRKPDYKTHFLNWQKGWDEPDADGIPVRIKGIEEIEKETIQSASNPEISQYLKNKFSQFKATEAPKQLIKANQIFEDQARGELVSRLDSLQREANVPGVTAEQYYDKVSTGLGLIEAHKRTGVFKSSTEAENVRIGFLNEMEVAQLKKDIDTNPTQTIGLLRDGYYTRIDPKSTMDWIHHAQAIAEQRERKRLHEADLAEKTRDKVVKAEQEDRTYAHSINIVRGKFTLDQILNDADSRLITREQFEHLAGMQRSQDERMAKKREVEDDPDTKKALWPDLLSVTPKTGEKQLTALWKDGKLSDKSYDWAMDRIRTEKNRSRDDSKSDIRYRHSQAEELLKRSLSPKGPLEKYDNIEWFYITNGMEELTKRSSAYGGQEDPLMVADELVRRYRPVVQKNTMMNINEIKSGLEYKSRHELERAWQMKDITKRKYESQRAIWDQLDALELYMRKMMEPTKESELSSPPIKKKRPQGF